MAPLEKLNSLPRQKRTAFIALFAGAWSRVQVCRRGDTGEVIPPKFGKAECEWVDDWHNFWTRELPELGFITAAETEPKPALGMAPGSTYWYLEIEVTPEGREAREAYWADIHSSQAA